jgi:OFA family oxalate/formate antiporter-like MFS transporter
MRTTPHTAETSSHTRFVKGAKMQCLLVLLLAECALGLQAPTAAHPSLRGGSMRKPYLCSRSSAACQRQAPSIVTMSMEEHTQSHSPRSVLASCLMLSVVSGSFYTWSLLMPSLQTALGLQRAPLSAVFSFATVCFTCGTSIGPFLFSKLSPSQVILTMASVSAAGLFLASFSGAWAASGSTVLALAPLIIGFAVAFGSMSGMAYALNAKISTSSLFGGREGFATGLLVSGRAAAPVVATPLMLWSLGREGPAGALRALGLYVGVSLLPVALALRGLRLSAVSPVSSAPANARDVAETDDAVGAGPPSSRRAPHSPPARSRSSIVALWIALLCGSGPGLLCHGHSAAILSACGTQGSLAAFGVAGMGIGSIAGRFGGGLLIDRIPARGVLTWLPWVVAPVVVAPLLLPTSVSLTLCALVGCGLIYGLNAVALPVVVSRLWDKQSFSSIYGVVFTAWGAAGVVAPLLAGRLFDLTGGYSAALVVSSASFLVAGLAAQSLPPDRPSSGVEHDDGPAAALRRRKEEKATRLAELEARAEAEEALLGGGPFIPGVGSLGALDG